MLKKLSEIQRSTTPYHDLSNLLLEIHKSGPETSEILERLALYREFHGQEFSQLEEQIVSALGLFYKIQEPRTLYSLILSAVGKQHKEEFGQLLTPVQASVRRAIGANQFISISAPTSAGKSYSIRDFIAEHQGDAIVIVPSRALIAEYINSVRERFNGSKNVMVTPFVDNVFTSRSLRRIFVLTPERARELFYLAERPNVGVVFFDEAQISEEKGRGIVFDVLVRRVQKTYPEAKLIFAHPFVDNPDAQFKKHRMNEDRSYSRSYTQGAVGRVSVFKHSNQRDYYFSPHHKDGHHLRNCVEIKGGFDKFAFNGQHSILIFVSKASIYSGEFVKPFESYIQRLRTITDQRALEIIEAVRHILGADENEHRSRLVALLKKGVVIHHGSVPLEVRFLLEDFIRGNHARICFATSTLAQGINMPFDIVWLNTMRIIGEGDADRALSFKNLIGRAGRLTAHKKFDYGYVFTSNPTLYASRINERFRLSEVSQIDSAADEVATDLGELIESVREGTFDDELNLPRSKVERLSDSKVQVECKVILDLIYERSTIKESIAGDANTERRKRVREAFHAIYSASIGRDLLPGEASVFNTAIMIFLMAIGGRTFREIAGIRYSEISRRDEGRRGEAAFAQQASKLPDAKLVKAYPLFKDVLAKDVSYDAVVFDTYDYIDQVISFSLSDVFMAAFKIYGKLTHDARHERMVELLRFGTNDVIHVLLMRYGFPPESVAEITPYLQFVNEKEIRFNPQVESAPQHIKDLVEWYLP